MDTHDFQEVVDFLIDRIADRISDRLSGRLADGRDNAHPEWLTVAEAARYLRLSASQLNSWRVTGQGIPYVKLAKCVRYRRSDLDKFMSDRMKRNTGQ